MSDAASPSPREIARPAAPTPALPSYVLVTPARNEAELIGQTLESMIAQTYLPLRWIIVSDASTDETERIVRGYTRRFAWIELLRVEESGERSFARKARAFQLGYERLHDVPYDIIGNLDADVAFGPDHFGALLRRFAEMPDLGVAGAPFIEDGVHYDYRFTDIHHVAGACQLFRRACFEDIGGYVPAESGIDAIAVITARMKGWTTRTFVECAYVHSRAMGSADRRTWQTWLRRGREDHALGGSPSWQLARSLYQSTLPPYLIGGLLLLCGYTHALLSGAPRAVSPELADFRRAEQSRRLRRFAAGLLTRERGTDHEARTAAVSIDAAIQGVERWVEHHDYKGYEPFDGLSSSLRPLTFGNRFLEQVLQQVGRRSPFNLRPLLGIEPLESTKGRGYMAMGYLTELERTGADEARTKAVACLEWLMRNKSPLYEDYSWGNHFDYASRAGQYSRHESILVWTALIGQAFLDGYERLGDARYLEVAQSVCRWILRLPREATASGTCLSYLAARQLSIHNANLLGAAMLARTAAHSGSAELLQVARAAVEYSCSRQRADGAWLYGEEPRYAWIDNFHTGYDLDSLKSYIESSGDRAFQPNLERGFHYFKQTFVGPAGEPRYHHDRTYPIDIQCAAQAIETLAKFADEDPEALPLAARVTRWTLRHMRDPSGFFYYRRYPFLTSRIPMLHWGQATMYRALTLLALKSSSPAGRG